MREVVSICRPAIQEGWLQQQQKAFLQEDWTTERLPPTQASEIPPESFGTSGQGGPIALKSLEEFIEGQDEDLTHNFILGGK